MDATNLDHDSNPQNENAEKTFKAEDIKGELEHNSHNQSPLAEENQIKKSVMVIREKQLDQCKTGNKVENYQSQPYKRFHTEEIGQNEEKQEYFEINPLDRQFNQLEMIINQNSNLMIPNIQQNQFQALNSNKGFHAANQGFIQNNPLSSINQSYLIQQQPPISMPMLFNGPQVNNPMLAANHFGANGQSINSMSQPNYINRSNSNMMPMFMYQNQIPNKLFHPTNIPQANFINTTSIQDNKLTKNDNQLSKLLGNSNIGIQTPMPYYLPNMQLPAGMQQSNPSSMNGIQIIPTLMYVVTTPQSSNFQSLPQGLNPMSNQNLLLNGTNYTISNHGSSGPVFGANLSPNDHSGFHDEKILQRTLTNSICTTANTSINNGSSQLQAANEWDSANLLQYILDPSKRIGNVEKLRDKST